MKIGNVKLTRKNFVTNILKQLSLANLLKGFRNYFNGLNEVINCYSTTCKCHDAFF